MALLDPHPALKAASEQASPADMFLGDDFHHNGAFRLSYGFEYAAMMETAKEANTHFDFDRADTYQWYLDLGALSNVNDKYLHGKLPTWNDFVNHPNYDEFWQKQAFPRYIHSPKVPNLNVGGWWDQEDFYGPLKIYELFEKDDPHHLNYLVAGPWNHGGWARSGWQQAGRNPARQQHQQIFQDADRSSLVRLLAEGQGHARLPGSHGLSDRLQPLGEVRLVAAALGPARATSTSTRTAGFPSTRPRTTAPTAISPTRRIRCRTAIGRSARPTPAAAGPHGWWRISASSRAGRTF